MEIKYIAFFRGINTSGIKLTAEDQKNLFENAGFTNVETVLTTGNIIFESTNTKPDLSFLPVPAFIKLANELRDILKNHPFAPQPNYHIYVLISEPNFTTIAMRFSQGAEETVKVVNDAIYWQVPVGQTLKTPFGKILGKSAYRDKFTSRNLNTIERIVKKLT